MEDTIREHQCITEALTDNKVCCIYIEKGAGIRENFLYESVEDCEDVTALKFWSSCVNYVLAKCCNEFSIKHVTVNLAKIRYAVDQNNIYIIYNRSVLANIIVPKEDVDKVTRLLRAATALKRFRPAEEFEEHMKNSYNEVFG